jgi:hypothetical protein
MELSIYRLRKRRLVTEIQLTSTGEDDENDDNGALLEMDINAIHVDLLLLAGSLGSYLICCDRTMVVSGSDY